MHAHNHKEVVKEPYYKDKINYVYIESLNTINQYAMYICNSKCKKKTQTMQHDINYKNNMMENPITGLYDMNITLPIPQDTWSPSIFFWIMPTLYVPKLI